MGLALSKTIQVQTKLTPQSDLAGSPLTFLAGAIVKELCSGGGACSVMRVLDS